MSEFEEFDFKQTIDVPIPTKCEGCAVQCELQAQVKALIFEKHIAESIGGSLVGEAGESFDAMLEANLPEEEAEEAKQTARQAMSKGIDAIDKELESAQQEINANALSCSGVLKMRATKEDVRYTVSVCTSPRVYLRDSEKPEHLPAHIKAESVNKTF